MLDYCVFVVFVEAKDWFRMLGSSQSYASLASRGKDLEVKAQPHILPKSSSSSLWVRWTKVKEFGPNMILKMYYMHVRYLCPTKGDGTAKSEHFGKQAGSFGRPSAAALISTPGISASPLPMVRCSTTSVGAAAQTLFVAWGIKSWGSAMPMPTATRLQLQWWMAWKHLFTSNLWNSLPSGGALLNMYEYTWVHRRGINLNAAVLHIHTINTFETKKYSRILTLNIYLKRNTSIYKGI